jgi:hypothetical protein
MSRDVVLTLMKQMKSQDIQKNMLNRVLDQTTTLSKAHKVFDFSVLGEIAKAFGEKIQIVDSEKKKSVKKC